MQTKPSLIPADTSLPSLANVKADETMFGHFLDWLMQEFGVEGFKISTAQTIDNIVRCNIILE